MGAKCGVGEAVSAGQRERVSQKVASRMESASVNICDCICAWMPENMEIWKYGNRQWRKEDRVRFQVT